MSRYLIELIACDLIIPCIMFLAEDVLTFESPNEVGNERGVKLPYQHMNKLHFHPLYRLNWIENWEYLNLYVQ